MPASFLPPNPSLEQLRKQAKELRADIRAGYPKFVDPARALHPRLADPRACTLADAQLVLARMLGFASWRRLREHLDVLHRYARSPQRDAGTSGIADEFLRLACVTYGADDLGRVAQARAMLTEHPDLGFFNGYVAAALGDVGAVAQFLAADAALADREGGPYGWPPLLYLALSRVHGPGHAPLDAARLLLAYGADPNAGFLPDAEPPAVTALSGAFRGRRDPVNQPAHRDGPSLARLLLSGGADPNDPRALGNLEHDPAGAAHLALLLEHGLGRGSGGPWRARLGHRQPAPAQLVEEELRCAAEADRADRVRLLMPVCANLDEACDAAVRCGNTGIAEELAAAGATRRPLTPVDALVAACLRVDRPAVDRLLAADPGLPGRAIAATWPPPLHRAAALGRTAAVRLLVEVGFPVNDATLSPLHTAAVTGHLDVVRLLVDLGADPSAVTHDDDIPGQFSPPDDTPAGWARYAGHEHVVAFLRSVE